MVSRNEPDDSVPVTQQNQNNQTEPNTESSEQNQNNQEGDGATAPLNDDLGNASDTQDGNTDNQTSPDADDDSKAKSEAGHRTKQPSHRMQKRIAELSRKVREAYQTASKAQPAVGGVQTNQEPVVDWEQEYTPDELNNLITQRAAQIAQPVLTEVEGLKKEIALDRAFSNLSRAANNLEKDFPELNPDSSQYKPELAEKVYNRMEAAFTENIFSDVEALGRDLVEASRIGGRVAAQKVSKEISKQATSGAVRSNTSPKAESPISETSADFLKLSPSEQQKELEKMEERLLNR